MLFRNCRRIDAKAAFKRLVLKTDHRLFYLPFCGQILSLPARREANATRHGRRKNKGLDFEKSLFLNPHSGILIFSLYG